jgi:hypothetical protein
MMRRFKFLLSFARDRNVERDRSAPSQLARYPHIAAVKHCDALHDRQSQASASRTLGTGGIDPEEAIKNSRQGFRRNTYPCVGDRDANRGRVGIRAQHHGSAGWRVC